jgi:class 3 adenylate cyclase
MKQTEILDEIKAIFKTQWKTRKGRIVPDAESVSLGNDAVTIDGTILYADMTDSTGLVNGYKDWFAAEVYKAYLIAACKAIRHEGGEITAFDGDRVMAVFIGDAKNSSATKAAMHINYLVNQINSILKIEYPNTAFKLQQSIGIDTSPLFVAKTGIRDSNDLVWVGRAANYAAKLCALVDANYPIYITEDVYDKLNDRSKYSREPRKNMWEKRTWIKTGLSVYRSGWWWKIT